jgi:hypothetical protein
MAVVPALQTRISVISAAMSVVGAMALAVLSHFEHIRSVKPSFIINIYLLASILFDAARIRTQALMSNDANNVLGAVIAALLAVKLVFLMLEATEKRALLRGLYAQLSLENTSGLISRSSFWWLNSLLISGYKTVLSLPNLPAIHEKLNSEHLAAKLQPIWDVCRSSRKNPPDVNLCEHRRPEEKACIGIRLCVESATGNRRDLHPEVLLRCAQYSPGLSHPRCCQICQENRVHQHGLWLDRRVCHRLHQPRGE